VLTLPPPADEHLDISALETWLWDAARVLRESLQTSPPGRDRRKPSVASQACETRTEGCSDGIPAAWLHLRNRQATLKEERQARR
jgi:hypothetical protein